MDNAQVHRHLIISDIIEEAGCKLSMLPPYSPGYNSIAMAFIIMKNWIAQHHIEFTEGVVAEEMDLCFTFAMSTIESRQAMGFFRHRGYV